MAVRIEKVLMDPSDPVSDIGLSWRMREHEARLLADSLRTSRLTLLYAGAGASRRALLRDGVVPLMARRETDVADRGFLESRVVAPFVDQRDAGGEGVERVVFFGDWHGDPVAALLGALTAEFAGGEPHADARAPHLADALEEVSERLGARLLIVLDAVEQLWSAGAAATSPARFIEAFGEAVNRPGLRANFLLAVDDRYEGKLEALRREVPRFDDSTVRLLGFEDAAPLPPPPPPPVAPRRDAGLASPRTGAAHAPPVLSDAVVTAPVRVTTPAPSRPRRPRPAKTPSAPPVPIKTDGVYAFIESTLTQTADASAPWHDDDGIRPPPGDAPAGASRGPRDAGAGRAIERERREHVRAAARPAPGPSLHEGPRALAAEPSSPIDEWLDAAIAWCRRMLRVR